MAPSSLHIRQTVSRRVPELAALLAFVLLQMVGVCSANYLYFNYPNFTDTQYLKLQNNASASGSFVWLLENPDPSWRTGTNDTVSGWSGWMSFDYALSLSRLDPTTQLPAFQSFNTSFTFQLVTPGADGDSPSGMAFFMTTYDSAPAIPVGMYFGLSGTDPNFFAVEFDTFQSQYTTDPSNSHVGIDIGSANSSAVVDTSGTTTNSQYYPQLYLYNNTAFKVWVSYDSSSQLIKVWMTNNPSDYAAYLDPPDDLTLSPILQYYYDLSSVFSTSGNQYVGFSARTQSNSAMLGVVLYSWYFIFDNGSSSSPPPPSSSTVPPPPPPIAINKSPAPPPPPRSKNSPPPPPPSTTATNSDNPLFGLGGGAGHSYAQGSSKVLYAILCILVGLILGHFIAP